MSRFSPANFILKNTISVYLDHIRLKYLGCNFHVSETKSLERFLDLTSDSYQAKVNLTGKQTFMSISRNVNTDIRKSGLESKNPFIISYLYLLSPNWLI